MITVSILINNKPLYTRSARRIKGEIGEQSIYKTDAGDIIDHHYNDGAIKLGIKMLKTIKRVSRKK